MAIQLFLDAIRVLSVGPYPPGPGIVNTVRSGLLMITLSPS